MGKNRMGNFGIDLDSQLSHLEAEWRDAYESGSVARAEFLAVMVSPEFKLSTFDQARDRLDRAEAVKVQIIARMDRLEADTIQRD